MKKEMWKTPELVILAKGKPEESVLASCKMIEGFLSEIKPGSRKCIIRELGVWVDCKARAIT
ncbi:MAG TPA: hypothetical protein PKN36_00085 [bacterium]|nr:hypothetical protein [bacterium]